VRGAAAGVVAAGAWAAGEPILRRLLDTPYSDIRLLGRLVSRERGWPVAGLALHMANGAAFGAAFERAGLSGVKAGLTAAHLENLALWPALAVMDEIHPDRREGNWPRLVTNRRIMLHELVAHSLFGAVLGTLVRR
jgi:hypothetical protein